MTASVSILDIDDWLENGTLICSRPGKVLLGWGQRQWQSSLNCEFAGPLFYFPHFSLDDKNPWFWHHYTAEFSIEDLSERVAAHPDLAGLRQGQESYVWENPCQTLFNRAFFDLQVKIQANELAKGVPYVFEHTKKTMSQTQLLRSLTSLLSYSQKNPAHVYGFWGQGQGILGATPEILFQLDGSRTIKTMACAGTVKNSVSDGGALVDDAFLQDPKEVHEHKLVVQGIKESLSAYGTVRIGAMQLLKLATLSHLMTPIDICLSRPVDFEHIVHALHPTPALGAFPREAGLQWLKEYQGLVDRRRFGAPAGYVFPLQNKALCYVAIRNVQWSRDEMCIGAGCGVVANSQSEKEWDEINLKLDAIKGMLAL